jgi:membrane protein, transporter, MFS superfamily
MRKGRLVPFLTVAVSGEVLYSAFEAFKGALMIPLQEMLGISQTQFGLLMTYVGLALFFYLPAGWINNRFRVRTIILCSLGWRLVTYLVLFLLDPPFGLMAAIAVTWAIVDAIVWPAVANGVCVLAADEDQKGRGLAMGLLESIRRFVEFALNGIVIVVLMFLPDATTTVMRVFAIAYTLLIVPMMIAVVRYVPDTRIATQARASHSVAALKGLLHVLSRPRIWLAGIAAMTVYWADINLMYVSAPYLQQVFHVSTAMSGAFGLLNTGLVAIVAGVVSGIVSDYVFKSSTRMMAVALGCVAVTCGLVLLLPVTRVMIIPILVLLIVVALATFLGKSVILAPIGELELPEEIAGSAMAVGSFLAYASILWGYNLNGYLLDSHASDPAAGYRIIFMITAGVTVIGCATAVILDRVNRRAAMRVDTADGAADADDRTAADS